MSNREADASSSTATNTPQDMTMELKRFRNRFKSDLTAAFGPHQTQILRKLELAHEKQLDVFVAHMKLEDTYTVDTHGNDHECTAFRQLTFADVSAKNAKRDKTIGELNTMVGGLAKSVDHVNSLAQQ